MNTQLPDAKLKSEKGLDKLSFYQQAVKDSERLSEEKRTDPYWLRFSNSHDSMVANPTGQHTVSQYQEYVNPMPDNSQSEDANESKVYSKLDQLNTALAASRRTASERELYPGQYTPSDNAAYSSHVHQLEEMISRMKEDKTTDPEVAQLNQMLDKIAAIQHPGGEKDTIPANQDIHTNEHALAVNKKDNNFPVSMLQGPDGSAVCIAVYLLG